ncbi:hypothetical protein QTA57_15570 [Fontisubflavum oceani]|uniref:hypothetical protein n=1 Tax=Fontisubflavum oceani TaxID=2978973 RepID=UPI0025B3D9B9|nr:hypothetical protein [Fontisubflavum oceani]WJY21177.1 hypothetical protein QTA57_15570 [Fontisubflavum oceani]
MILSSDNGQQVLKLLLKLFEDFEDCEQRPRRVEASDGILKIDGIEFTAFGSQYLIQNSISLQHWLAETKPHCLLD